MKDLNEIKDKLMSSELKPDCGAVFMDSYPDESDAKGWCKVHSDDWLHGNLFKRSVKRMDELEAQVDAVTKTAIMSAINLLHSVGVSGHVAEDMWKNGEL